MCSWRSVAKKKDAGPKLPHHPLFPWLYGAMINMDMIGRMKDSSDNRWRGYRKGMAGDDRHGKLYAGNHSNPSAKPGDLQPHSSLPICSLGNGSAVISVDTGKAFDIALNQEGFAPATIRHFTRSNSGVFFWTGTHEDYHKPSDTADKINTMTKRGYEFRCHVM